MSGYEITVSITPLCSSCGAELEFGMTESKKPHQGIFDRESPYKGTSRRVFVSHCAACFVHKSEVSEPGEQNAELLEALKACAAVCAGETMNKNGLVGALEMARAAIQKATGGEA